MSNGRLVEVNYFWPWKSCLSLKDSGVFFSKPEEIRLRLEARVFDELPASKELNTAETGPFSIRFVSKTRFRVCWTGHRGLLASVLCLRPVFVYAGLVMSGR